MEGEHRTLHHKGFVFASYSGTIGNKDEVRRLRRLAGLAPRPLVTAARALEVLAPS